MENEILLRVDGEWVPYKGSTSLRKLYYRASSMVRSGTKSFYVHDYEDSKVDAAIFPDRFWRSLSCSSMNGVDVHLLPTRLFAKGVLTMNHNVLREKPQQWFKRAYKAIHQAGGNPDVILERLDKQTLDCLISNNIFLVYDIGE